MLNAQQVMMSQTVIENDFSPRNIEMNYLRYV